MRGGRGEKAPWGPPCRTGSWRSRILRNSHLKTQAGITKGIPTGVQRAPPGALDPAAEQVQ